MKKSIFILVGVIVLLLSAGQVQAQEKADYFVGTWKILVEGTPNGDATSIIVFERKDGKLAGEVRTGQTSVKISRVEEKSNEVTAYFTSASGYEVYIYLEKVDENKVEGSMMDMFDAKGERVVEKKE